MLCDPDNMPHAVDLAHLSVTQDAYGGDTQTADANYASDEPAWVQTSSASEIREFRARNQNVTHTIYLTRDPGLRLDDQLTVKLGPYAGTVLSILAFREATVGMGLLWQVMCSGDREAR